MPQSQLASSVAVGQTALAAAPSFATSATKLEADFVKPDDLKSVVSHQSLVSTVMNVKGEKLEWPEPPTQMTSNGYFTCPYCRILCPQRYLAKNTWRVHLIHDLQPYHCTYKDCSDPHRLYGSRQEWIDHESQHSRVWHCQVHGEEFETQPNYVEHLKMSHPETTPGSFSPELIAAVVGPSLEPHRDCPFCPTAFSETIEMQKHMTEDGSGRPSDSHQVQHHSRQGSVHGDFDVLDEGSFADIRGRDDPQSPGDDQNLTKKNLDQISAVSSGASGWSVIWLWLGGLLRNPLAGEADEVRIEWSREYDRLRLYDLGQEQVPPPSWQDIAEEALLDRVNEDISPNMATEYLRIYREAGGDGEKILQIIRDEALEHRMWYWVHVTRTLSTAGKSGNRDLWHMPWEQFYG
ncbi:hypothetical protein F4818DRAFT_452679 [Hypoxylon cercidicola]|nr:hypothetical protein F4818DRAFT_452679 [Hypoxylon cercidicola]